MRFDDFVAKQLVSIVSTLTKQYKAALLYILEKIAYIGIDVQLQVDALREDFVKSNTFLDFVHTVFEECDVDKNNKLGPAEFYAAVLLLYHKVHI